jgi:hypothetical protein
MMDFDYTANIQNTKSRDVLLEGGGRIPPDKN